MIDSHRRVFVPNVGRSLSVFYGTALATLSRGKALLVGEGPKGLERESATTRAGNQIPPHQLKLQFNQPAGVVSFDNEAGAAR